MAAAARAEREAAAAADIRSVWAELQVAQERNDVVMAGRLTGRLGVLVAGLRAEGVSMAEVADLVSAPVTLVRRWLRAAGGGR